MYAVYGMLLRVECAQHCKSCNIKGTRKCDPEQCKAGYVYNFGTKTCDREFVIAVFYSAACNGAAASYS